MVGTILKILPCTYCSTYWLGKHATHVELGPMAIVDVATRAQFLISSVKPASTR